MNRFLKNIQKHSKSQKPLGSGLQISLKIVKNHWIQAETCPWKLSQKWPKMIKNDQIGQKSCFSNVYPRMSKMTKNDQKWSKMTKNWPFSPYFQKSLISGLKATFAMSPNRSVSQADLYGNPLVQKSIFINSENLFHTNVYARVRARAHSAHARDRARAYHSSRPDHSSFFCSLEFLILLSFSHFQTRIHVYTFFWFFSF